MQKSGAKWPAPTMPRLSDKGAPKGHGSEGVLSSARCAKSPASKRVWADDLPAVAIEEFVAFVVVGWAAFRERLNEAAGGGRGVEKQDAADFAAGVLQSMLDVARHECAGAGPADRDRVSDHKSKFAGERQGDLVAVAAQMEEACGAGRLGFLEHHDALIGLSAE